MILAARSHWYTHLEMSLASTVSLVEEGQPLIAIMENGGEVVGFQTGSASNSDKFAGIAENGMRQPTQNTLVSLLTVPASGPYTITLPKVPINNGSIAVRNTNSGVAYTQGTAADGVYSVASNVLTFHSSNATVPLTIVYRYTMSSLEADTTYGNERYRNSASAFTRTVSVIKHGTVFTTNFDSGINWAANPVPVVGANGVITTGTGGAMNGRVVHAPTVTDPFLGVAFLVA